MINRRTQSRPAIVHSPGMTNPDYYLTNPCWTHALRISRKAKSGQPEDTEIVLCNNLKVSAAETSLKNSGLEYTVLGRNVENWDNMYKIKLVLDHMDKTRAKNILYMDSADAVVVGNLAPCVGLFRGMNCEIVFSSELKFYPSCPSLNEAEQFEKAVSPNEYFALNAGCWMGKKNFVRKMMEEILFIDINEHLETNRGFIEDWRISKSDQFRWHLLYRKYHPEIRLDHNCLIFQNIFLHKPGDLALDML